jgi:hypothetical protein
MSEVTANAAYCYSVEAGYSAAARPVKNVQVSESENTKRWPANVFLSTCITTLITEAHINLVSVSVWTFPTIGYKDSTYTYRDKDRAACLFNVPGINWKSLICTKETNQQFMTASYGLWATILSFDLILLLPLWYMSCRRCGGTTTLSPFAWMIVLALIAVGTFSFSWIMWLAFLNGTADEDYCVSDIRSLNAVNIVYPILLGIWRQIV